MIATAFGKAARPDRVAPGRVARVRGRRKDDAAFAVIGVALALFFLIEFGWVIAHRSLPDLL
jgi:hypothetical protein